MCACTCVFDATCLTMWSWPSSELVQGGQQELHAHWLLPAPRYPTHQASKDELCSHQQRKYHRCVELSLNPHHLTAVKPLCQCILHVPLLLPVFLLLSEQVKYKEAYEMTKAKCYTLHPEGVNFVNTRKANKIANEVS